MGISTSKRRKVSRSRSSLSSKMTPRRIFEPPVNTSSNPNTGVSHPHLEGQSQHSQASLDLNRPLGSSNNTDHLEGIESCSSSAEISNTITIGKAVGFQINIEQEQHKEVSTVVKTLNLKGKTRRDLGVLGGFQRCTIPSERRNSSFCHYTASDFNEFIAEAGLQEFNQGGKKFTYLRDDGLKLTFIWYEEESRSEAEGAVMAVPGDVRPSLSTMSCLRSGERSDGRKELTSSVYLLLVGIGGVSRPSLREAVCTRARGATPVRSSGDSRKNPTISRGTSSVAITETQTAVRCMGLCDDLYGMGKYMARTRLIKAGIMMTERVCLVSLSDGDWYVSHGLAELLLFEAQDPRSIRGTYRVIQEAECMVHRFEILAECVGGTGLIVAAVWRMILEAISRTSIWINDVQSGGVWLGEVNRRYLLDYHFASGTKLARDGKSLSQPCMIEVADVKTLTVRHEYQSYTLEEESRSEAEGAVRDVPGDVRPSLSTVSCLRSGERSDGRKELNSSVYLLLVGIGGVSRPSLREAVCTRARGATPVRSSGNSRKNPTM
ncbi:hypothetical protein LXL04_021627 [Taraxacum kok-saghyz]